MKNKPTTLYHGFRESLRDGKLYVLDSAQPIVDYVVDHGVEFDKVVVAPCKVNDYKFRLGQPKECFRNSGRYVGQQNEFDDLFYTEGFVWNKETSMVFTHGWLTTSKGLVVELTSPNHAYLGLPFTSLFHRQQITKHEQWSLFYWPGCQEICAMNPNDFLPEVFQKTI